MRSRRYYIHSSIASFFIILGWFFQQIYTDVINLKWICVWFLKPFTFYYFLCLNQSLVLTCISSVSPFLSYLSITLLFSPVENEPFLVVEFLVGCRHWVLLDKLVKVCERPDNRLHLLSLSAYWVESVLKSLLSLLFFSIKPTELLDWKIVQLTHLVPNKRHINFQDYMF